MGILDAVLGLRTSAATQAATQEGQQLYNLANYFGNQALNNTTNDANSALRAGASDATGALTRALATGRSDLAGYDDRAQGSLDAALGSAANTAQASNGAFAPYAASGTAASGALSDALGLNGATGNSRATAAFQTAPGYGFQVNQATDAASRAAAAAGMGASGNVLDAVARIGAGLAGQQFQNYVSDLSGVGSQGLTAASGQSANDRAAATIQGQGGITGATLQQDTGTKLGALSQALGLGQATVDQNLGGALSGNFTNLGQNISNLGLATAKGVSDQALIGGNAADSAANANSAILGNMSKFIGGDFLSGGPLTSALKGLGSSVRSFF